MILDHKERPIMRKLITGRYRVGHLMDVMI